MRHGSLFTGWGGFDLAAERMGWENVFQVEKDSGCSKLLAYRFPQTKRYGAIEDFDGREYTGRIDVLSGGFPCQPVSNAGKRKGNQDYRWLWPQNDRVIREIRPRFYVGENVRGLINWNGGILFDKVQADLEDAGYEVAPFLLPACAVGLDHERERIFFVAHRRDDVHPIEPNHRTDRASQGARQGEHKTNRQASHRERIRVESHPGIATAQNHWGDGGSEPVVGGMVHEFPGWLERIRGAGNAVAPKLAFEIFKAIESTSMREGGISNGPSF